jgi:2-dehydropantoate 2-reductase
MKVSVIGPGTMGCLFAGKLLQAGTEVSLVDHRPERAVRLAEQGITVETETETIRVRPPVVSSVPNGQDLVIVATKSYDTAQLSLPKEVPVVSFQSGLNNIETLCSMVGSAHVIAGMTYESALNLGEGAVRHTASGTTRIGSWTSCPTATAQEILVNAGFEVEITEAPGQMLWEKVAVDAGVQPLCALLGVPYGDLLQMAEARQLLRDLVVEAVKVASTEGYRFDYSLIELAESICAAQPQTIPPMMQDVQARKPTEIDAISGEILRRAQLAGLPTPRSRVVWQLVKSLERR